MAYNCGLIVASVLCALLLRLYLVKINLAIVEGQMNWYKEVGNDGSRVQTFLTYDLARSKFSLKDNIIIGRPFFVFLKTTHMCTR